MALCLCLIMTLLPVSARAASSMEEEILPVLAVMGVMNGDQNGRLDLSYNVTRAQFVKMAVSASSLKSQGKAVSSVSPYPDVPAGAWCSGYITAARDSGLVSGYLDGTFRPDSYVTLEEGISVMLKAMGYGDADFAAGYPAAHLALYHSLKMDDGMTVSRGQAMTRGDCARLIYNCLNAKAKSGTTYALQLGYAVDNQGKINYAALAVSETQGPVLMTSLVSAAVGFTPVTVYRDRRTSTLADVKYGDVLYYIEDVRTVWAYSDKISGKVQAISPSTASPSAVTVSGITCQLGSASAVYAFSDLGTVKVGDNVTLLLGAGGQCVFVETGSSLSQTVYGVVSSVGTQAVADSYGSAVQGKYMTVMSTDGGTYSYPYNGSIKAGEVVKAETTAGGISISRAKGQTAPSGTVKGGIIGSYTIDDSTEILDFFSTRAVTVNASRLEGVDIRQSDVALCLSEDGKHIDKLVLKNVTGDMLDYGVVTTAEESGSLMYAPSTYVYLVNGVPNALSVQANYNVKKGPCAVKYRDGAVSSLDSLTGKKLNSIGAFTCEVQGEGSMKLSDDLQVYVKQGDNYYYSNRMDVSLEKYDIRGYYDASTSQGGCVRVLIAEAK